MSDYLPFTQKDSALHKLKSYGVSVWVFGLILWGSEFLSYEIELRNRVTQNDVTLRVTNSEIFIEILLSSY